MRAFIPSLCKVAASTGVLDFVDSKNRQIVRVTAAAPYYYFYLKQLHETRGTSAEKVGESIILKHNRREQAALDIRGRVDLNASKYESY